MAKQDFDSGFKHLTGYEPFPWQRAMYERMVADPPGSIPQTAVLPTGLGKTNVIAVWLLALMRKPGAVQRRLVYVVNRRTVVDQTTAEVVRMKEQVAGLEDVFDDLKVSTLRGQFADNREWSADPSVPAVVCGTVDMVGSRLLFSGYGLGFRSRPLHAGFLGQDVLLVHDEAHLEPAFQQLVEAVAEAQRLETERTGFGRPMRVMQLSATAREGGGANAGQASEASRFVLTEADRENEVVQQRIGAAKRLELHTEDDKQLVDRLVELAGAHEPGGGAVLVFVRSVKDAERVAGKLVKLAGKDRVQALTGTMRAHERDALVRSDSVFARFMPESDRSAEADIVEGTVYLVSTSAGEVGVNLSADHLVCDLSTFESMAQRLGRVNRFGKRPDTRVDVVFSADLPSEDDVEKERAKKPGQQNKWLYLDAARRRTLELLQTLDGDASPAALSALDQSRCQAAYAPPPEIVPTSEVLFDTWSMTSIARPLAEGALPGCPPVAPYLHGRAEWEPPRTQVAWREEVERLDGVALDGDEAPEALLADYPLKPHELLQEQTDRVIDVLTAMHKRGTAQDATPVWHVQQRGEVVRTTLAAILRGDKQRVRERLAETVVLLPPKLGGLTVQGMLGGKQPYDERQHERYDVADQWLDPQQRLRRHREVLAYDALTPEAADGMRLVRRIELPLSDAGEGQGGDDDKTCCWCWYVRPASAEEAGSRSARFDQELEPHQSCAKALAAGMAERLGLGEAEATAVTLAAAWHDLGKDRALWQAAIRNDRYPEVVLAKSARPMLGLRLSRYRHEFGSLLDVLDKDGPVAAAFASLPEATQDLLLHLIAAHHGRARPHFSEPESFDPQPGRDADARVLSAETPRRFARLQRRYGRWGLAYLESLVRAADWAASAQQVPEEPEVPAPTATMEAKP